MREDELKATFLLAEDFENTVRKYYLAEGYRFIKANAVARDKGYDFSVASPKGGGKTLVETKVFRTRVVQRADILRAVANLEHARRDEGADRAVFFMTSAIAIPITDTGGTVVVDVAEFSRMLSQYAELSVELSSIVRTLTPMPASDFDVNAYVTFGDAYLAMREGAAPEKKGQSLALALKAVTAGKKGARAFEDKCVDALKHIFAIHLSSWSVQKVSDGGVSRFDLIARIASDHDFWKSIVTYFRSWYVVFEFKNYAQKLNQGRYGRRKNTYMWVRYAP